MKSTNESLSFISVVIPARNAGETLRACLESLSCQNYPEERMEVLVVDGCSEDNTVEIAKEFGVKIVPNPTISIATARNRGSEAARGDIIAHTDADCVLRSDWLRNGASLIQKTDAGGVTGAILEPDQNTCAQASAYIFELATRLGGSVHARRYAEVREVDDFPSCNAIYRQDALMKALPVDERLYAASDVAINYQLRQYGYRLLWSPDVVVWHKKRSTWRGFWLQMRRSAIGRVQLAKRWPRLLKAWHPAVAVSIPIWAIAAWLAHQLSESAFMGFLAASAFVVLAVSVDAAVRKRSWKLLFAMPFACAVFVLAWSVGFWRELIAPMKGPRAN